MWDDLDLSGGTLHVRAQLERKKKGEPARRVPLKAARRRSEARQREIGLHPAIVALVVLGVTAWLLGHGFVWFLAAILVAVVAQVLYEEEITR